MKRARQPVPGRLVVYDSDTMPTLFADRDSVRRRMVDMEPVSARDIRHVGLRRPYRRRIRPAGGSAKHRQVFWALVGADSVPVVYRNQNFATPEDAYDDAVTLLQQAKRMRPITVRDADGLYASWWFVLDGKAVLVSGRAGRYPLRITHEGMFMVLMKSVVWTR